MNGEVGGHPSLSTQKKEKRQNKRRENMVIWTHDKGKHVEKREK